MFQVSPAVLYEHFVHGETDEGVFFALARAFDPDALVLVRMKFVSVGTGFAVNSEPLHDKVKIENVTKRTN